MKRKTFLAALMVLVTLTGSVTNAVEMELTGPWSVRVRLSAADIPSGRLVQQKEVILHVQGPETIDMEAEYHESLPLFNPNAGGWARGARLFALQASECTAPFLLDPQSLVVRAGPDADSRLFTAGTDYQTDLDWGTVGRLADGAITASMPVYISYRYTPQRLDAVVLNRSGQIVWRQGNTRASRPRPPMPNTGERQLGHIYVPGPIEELAPKHLFPILAVSYPEPPKPSPTAAERLLPKTLERLRNGQPLRILAWGDSVTVGTYLEDVENHRWQSQVVARLRERFPRANITLVTEAWGGRNTASYLGEPPGSPHNYREKVLAAQPDLIISEFVNDAGLGPQQVEERYSKLLQDFQSIGAEWIIFTPHYVRPDWMGIDRERDIDQDPRPYVKGLREFGQKHQVAIADASLRWGHLWRQGIPYTTLLMNTINHPDEYGMQLFADALMELFPD
jgi:lysophospholipase L1-like esterase